MKQDHFDYAGFRKLNLENSLDAIDYCVKKKAIVGNNLIFFFYSFFLALFHSYCDVLNSKQSILDKIQEIEKIEKFNFLKEQVTKGK
jgi:hypothetical protein